MKPIPRKPLRPAPAPAEPKEEQTDIPVPQKPLNRRLSPKADVPTPEDTLLDRVEKDLGKEGVKPFTNENVDEDYLVLPRDITEVPPKSLGMYFNAFTQQKMWTRTLIGRVSALAKETNKKLDRERDRIYSALPAKMSVKEKELKVATDDACQQMIDDLEFYQQKLDVLGDYLDNLVDGIFNISREITRRGSDFNDENRGHNIGRDRR